MVNQYLSRKPIFGFYGSGVEIPLRQNNQNENNLFVIYSYQVLENRIKPETGTGPFT